MADIIKWIFLFLLQDELKIPKNSNEFVVEWRQLKDSSLKQCQFLLAIGTSKLSEFFKLDIAHGLLGQIIRILYLHYANIKIEDILAILEVFSASQRFSLSLLFFSSQETNFCKNLFENLEKDLAKSENSDVMQTLEKLKKRYSEILWTFYLLEINKLSWYHHQMSKYSFLYNYSFWYWEQLKSFKYN